jgi:hypothetical protein
LLFHSPGVHWQSGSLQLLLLRLRRLLQQHLLLPVRLLLPATYGDCHSIGCAGVVEE